MYKGYRMYIWKICSLQGRINENKERNCVTRRKYGVDVANFSEAFRHCTRKYKEAVPNEAGFIDISASNDREQ